MINRNNIIFRARSFVRARLIGAMACLAVLTLTSPGQAANFVVVAPHLIAVTGHIEQGDCDRWNAAVTPNIHTVVLQSPGGSVAQGQCISRSIAERHLKTFVPKRCSSICFLMFAAGAQHFFCDGARIGVHRPHNHVTGEESDPKHTEALVRRAASYGVPQPILDKIAGTPAKTIYVLTKEELALMNAQDAQGGCAGWDNVLQAAK